MKPAPFEYYAPKTVEEALSHLAGDIATAQSGRYYIGYYPQKAMEAESMWGRFVTFKEGNWWFRLTSFRENLSAFFNDGSSHMRWCIFTSLTEV